MVRITTAPRCYGVRIHVCLENINTTGHLTLRGAGVVPSCCDEFVLAFGFLTCRVLMKRFVYVHVMKGYCYNRTTANTDITWFHRVAFMRRGFRPSHPAPLASLRLCRLRLLRWATPFVHRAFRPPWPVRHDEDTIAVAKTSDS